MTSLSNAASSTTPWATTPSEISNEVMHADDDALAGLNIGKPAAAPVAHNQRVMDKVAQALHHACDIVDIEIAERLVQIMDRMVHERLLKADGTRRRAVETLVAAHEHLWQIRHVNANFEIIQEEPVTVAA